MRKKEKYFGGVKRHGISVIHIAVILLLSCFMGLTLAYFFDSDYGDGIVNMSGAVIIEAVGESGSPIEDVGEGAGKTSKLVVNLVDNYDYLIPGAPMSIPVSCKVYQSTTSPLLRASFTLKLYEPVENTTELREVDLNTKFPDENDVRRNFLTNVSGQLTEKIESHGWYLYNDYFYYVGNDFTESDKKDGDTKLKEVNVSDSDVIVDFIKASSRNVDGDLEGDAIIFPNYIDSSFSGFSVILSITFQGIQNFIPYDVNGDGVIDSLDNFEIGEGPNGVVDNRAENTIKNALLIFDSPSEDTVENPEL